MLGPGTTVTNPQTGTVFEMREIGAEHAVLRYTMPPKMDKPDIARHIHFGWHEDFAVLEGSGTYLLGSETGRVEVGETLAMPERIPHIHPWNTGDTPMVMDQIVSLSTGNPNAIRDTLGLIFTLYDWQAQGRIAVDSVGLPRNPIKFARAGRIFDQGTSYDARFPVAAQRMAAATVGRLAEALGVEMIDPKYR